MYRKLYRRAYQAINYRLGRWHGGRWAQYVRPTSISILLTRKCNSRCVHCDLWSDTGPDDSLDQEAWMKLLTDLHSWLGPVHVVLTGGESLLKSFTPDLVAHGSSLGLFVELLTNGYRNDPSLLEKVALGRPWRITLSVDGIGEAHNIVRGREDFWPRTSSTIDTLIRLRQEHQLDYTILLKCVVMRQNLKSISDVARYAGEKGLEVQYQPVEQNYNTPEDSKWFEKSPNWPENSERAVEAVNELISLKREGYPIANSFKQLAVMVPYFKDPAGLQSTVQAHTSHEDRPLCAAVSMLQVEPNGNVTICSKRPTVGNITEHSIKKIWHLRPHWWEAGACDHDHFCACSGVKCDS